MSVASRTTPSQTQCQIDDRAFRIDVVILTNGHQPRCQSEEERFMHHLAFGHLLAAFQQRSSVADPVEFLLFLEFSP